MVYRVYLINAQREATERTVTSDPAQAADAFRDLVNRTDLDGRRLAACLTHKNLEIAKHRFDRGPGDAANWRDRLDEIEWPTVGRPADLQGGRRVNVYLDAESLALAAQIGDGNVSNGIRRALKSAARC